MAQGLVFFITGVSSGLGYSLAMHALSTGHRVVGSVRSFTGRHSSPVSQLQAAGAKLVILDMDWSEAQIAALAKTAVDVFGRIDVLVNNAGYGLIGAVEDIPDEEARRQMSTNFFGPLTLIRVLLPTLRKQGVEGKNEANGKPGGSVIVNVSSVAGLDGLPSCGLYAASKFALEGLSEGLAREVAPLGIRTLIVEPGAFKTRFQDAINYVGGGEISEAYRGGPVEQVVDKLRALVGTQPGDPDKGAKVIVKQVISALEDEDRTDVRRVLLGPDSVGRMQHKLSILNRDLVAGEQDARSTDL